MNLPETKRLAALATGKHENLDLLWKMVHSGERETSINALWAITHLIKSDSAWLQSLQNEIIDMLLAETDPSQKRMLLQLLRDQQYRSDSIRTDFLDFCLSKINSESEPYAVRAYCIYTAFKLCRPYPELLAELQEHLSMLSLQTLSPGLECARRKTVEAIKKARNKN